MSVRNLGLTLDNTLGMEKQVNYICKSCYYQIRNISLIRKYINDKTCKTLVQALIISRLNYGNTLLYTKSAELCCTSGDTHSQKGIYNTSFVPAVLASCTFPITVQYPILYTQSTEFNSISVSKRSDRKIYTSDNVPI